MNCKQRDMARIVHSPFLPSALRQIVECVELTDASAQFPEICPAPYWLCRIAFPEKIFSREDGSLFTAPAGSCIVIPDAWLRPIRPGDEEIDGTDEALVLAKARDALPKRNDLAPKRQVEHAR